MGNGPGFGWFLNNFWEYDPTTDSWTQKANFAGGIRGYMSCFAIGNKGYAGMGYNSTIYLNDLWEYNPVTNVWTQMANLPGPGRGLAGSFSVNGKGYVGTGQQTGPALQDLWEYNPGTNSWVQKGNFPGVARQDIDRAVFTIGNFAYWGTGTDGWNGLDDFWQYDPATDTWTQKANYPAKRFGLTGFSICGMGYLGFGEDMPSYVDHNTFYTYDPAANTWTAVASCPGTGRCDAPAMVINNKAYLGTGNNFNTSVLKDWWEFTPSGVGSLTITATNSVVCPGTTVTLNATGGSNYNWNTGATTSSIIVTPSTSTTYTVTDPGNPCSSAGTILISVITQPHITIAGSASVCLGTSELLTAVGGGNYSWSTGATTISISVSPTATTTYSVVAATGTCADTGYFTVSVIQPPVAQIACVDTLCSGQTGILSASGGNTYLWSNGSTASAITVSPSANTTYSVIVSNSGCNDTANCSVVVKPSPTVNAGPDVTINSGESTTLSATGSGASNYSWGSGLDTAVIVVSPSATTFYVVTLAGANGCPAQDTVIVFVEQIDCSFSSPDEFFIPNAFSPNGDGENDSLKLYFKNISCITEFTFNVYNRWGENVFETNIPVTEWDGSYKGKKEGTEVFIYYMKAVLLSGNEVVKRGNISLVR